jgi:hypothetical protein
MDKIKKNTINKFVKKLTPKQRQIAYKKVKQLETITTTPMDNFQIEKYLPNVPIISYSDLPKYSSIEDILPHNNSYAVILYQNSENSGHWTALFRKDNKIYFFCSYGSKVDEPLNWISKESNKKLGINAPYLSILLNKTGMPVYYNTIEHQDEDKRVSTCGRYVVYFIKSMLNGQDLSDFNKKIKASGLPADVYVSERIL